MEDNVMISLKNVQRCGDEVLEPVELQTPGIFGMLRKFFIWQPFPELIEELYHKFRHRKMKIGNFTMTGRIFRGISGRSEKKIKKP